MAGIDQFIRSAVGELGVPQGAAESGVGSILKTLQGSADQQDFQQLISSMPGADALLAKAGGSGGGGGLLGQGMGALGSMLGGGAGGALGLLGALQGSGLSADSLGPFVSKFVEFAKSSAGQALMGKILGKAPELTKLLG